MSRGGVQAEASARGTSLWMLRRTVGTGCSAARGDRSPRLLADHVGVGVFLQRPANTYLPISDSVADMPSALRRLAGTVSTRSRTRALAWLLERIPAGSTVLLVGVSGSDRTLNALASTNLVEAGLRDHGRATVVTYDPTTQPVLGCPTVRGDGRRLPFRDGAFDYVVSNAVIEHVGGPVGARSMVDESVRVARKEVIHSRALVMRCDVHQEHGTTSDTRRENML